MARLSCKVYKQFEKIGIIESDERDNLLNTKVYEETFSIEKINFTGTMEYKKKSAFALFFLYSLPDLITDMAEHFTKVNY